MRGGRYLYAGTILLALVIGLGLWSPFEPASAGRQRVPRFVVDPFWPKPLPDRWVTGEVAGTCVDSQDHVFTVNRRNLLDIERTLGEVVSPTVIEFDPDGNVVNAWGDPAILPNGIHGCFVDHEDNVWIASNGDGVVQKYSHDGNLLLQIGTKGLCDGPGGACGAPGLNSSTTLLNQPADMAVDPSNGDVYIADGYGNHRVAVFDRSGGFLRQWGSPGTGPGQFAPGGGGHPHCVVFTKAGLLYVCDRANDRIQVFDRMGNLQSIIPVKPGTGTPGRGAVGSSNDLDFSTDKRQEFMYVNDPGNTALWIYNRASATILGGFGRPGHMAGEFTIFHSVAVDSRGNLYTGETIGGRRAQKFVPRGHVPDRKLGTYRGSPHYDPLPD